MTNISDWDRNLCKYPNIFGESVVLGYFSSALFTLEGSVKNKIKNKIKNLKMGLFPAFLCKVMELSSIRLKQVTCVTEFTEA